MTPEIHHKFKRGLRQLRGEATILCALANSLHEVGLDKLANQVGTSYAKVVNAIALIDEAVSEEIAHAHYMW